MNRKYLNRKVKQNFYLLEISALLSLLIFIWFCIAGLMSLVE